MRHIRSEQNGAATFCAPAVAAVAVAVVTAAGCATAPPAEQPYQFADDTPGAEAFEQWLQGDEPDITDPADAEQQFLVAEASFWNRDYAAAYDDYVAMLHDHPGHALNRYAVDRLDRMRTELPGFADRLTDDLEGISYDDERALTQVGLARLAYRISRDHWERSDADTPFAFGHAGFVDTWRATPALSPWPKLDFDTPLGPERTEQFADEYRAPLVAADNQVNYEPTRTVAVNGLRDRLNLGMRGIYYLESELQVSDEPREVVLSGVFPGSARVWVGDQLVVDAPNDDYGSTRLLRHVELQPGTHRVLVKLAYDRGSADWFELLWVPTGGEVLGEAGIDSTPEPQRPYADVELLGAPRPAGDLEPVRLADDEISHADAPTLYAAALSAFASGEFEAFSSVFDELIERYPEFVPGHLLATRQVRTRNDLPSETRQARATSSLRRAQQLAPDNLYVLVELERMLRDRGSDEEHRQILERARQLVLEISTDGAVAGQPAAPETNQLPTPRPLVAWARYVEQQNWNAEAERAWRQVLEVDPGDCTAIQRLRRLYLNRNDVRSPREFSPQAESCPQVLDSWFRDHPERVDDRVELAARRAGQLPYHSTRQIAYASALRAAGERVRAAEVLDEAIERMPHQRRLWNARIDLAVGDGDESTARRLIDEASERLGRSAELEWQRSRLDDELPLEQFLRDGREAALQEVRSTGERDDVDEDDESERAMVLDDAYYVVDFAGRKYFEDGSSWTLTHQVVRVMTRGAIDDYAEMTVPGGAELLVARTIKEDGEVRVPEGVTGDSTISMPGLSRGDMVEIAYLQFDRASRVNSRIQGNRFFFRMPGISSRLSEYLVIGDDLQFESANGAPEPEPVDAQGLEGMRFVAEDVRRPRSESRRVSSTEYLPWVREFREGVQGTSIDFERRYMKNAIRSSARISPYVDRTLEEWLGAPLEDIQADDETIRRLFYAATDWFRSASPGRFTTDAAHALRLRRGSPLVVMHLALQQLGVDHDIFVARTDEQPQQVQQIGELDRYPRAVLRVRMPDSGELMWLKPDRREAMFGALEPEIVGENAICITCEQLREDTVAMPERLRPRRHIDLQARIGEDGTLTGTIQFELHGVRAARVRGALRGHDDEQDRTDYFEHVLTSQISGADVRDYRIHAQHEPGEPMAFDIDFERSNFARGSNGELVVDRPLFRETMQRLYARESTRNTPLFVGYEREQSYSARIDLPDGMELEFEGRRVDADGRFGDFQRHERVDDGVFKLDTAIDLPRQRIEPDDYHRFRDWTRTVERSGDVWMRLTAADR